MIRDFRFFRNLELKKKKKKFGKNSTNSNARRKAKSSISLCKSIQKTEKKKNTKKTLIQELSFRYITKDNKR